MTGHGALHARAQGVRYTRVKTPVSFNNLVNLNDPPATNESEVDDLMPSVTLRYDVTDTFRLRANYGETLRRQPNAGEVRNIQEKQTQPPERVLPHERRLLLRGQSEVVGQDVTGRGLLTEQGHLPSPPAQPGASTPGH